GAQDVGDFLRAARLLLAHALVLVALGLRLGVHVGARLRLALDLGALRHVALDLGLHLGAGILRDRLARARLDAGAHLGFLLGLALLFERRLQLALAPCPLLGLHLHAGFGLDLAAALR